MTQQIWLWGSGLTGDKCGDSQFGQTVSVSLDALLQRLERGQYGARPARHQQITTVTLRQ